MDAPNPPKRKMWRLPSPNFHIQYTMHRLQLPRLLLFSLIISLLSLSGVQAQQEGKPLLRGSLIEDRAARKLIEAGDTRYDAGEKDKAVEIWTSVLERYPRSKQRFT
ncbi:MAG: hypothetical protein VXB01_17070, partial [Opitutae bacterium]